MYRIFHAFFVFPPMYCACACFRVCVCVCVVFHSHYIHFYHKISNFKNIIRGYLFLINMLNILKKMKSISNSSD